MGEHDDSFDSRKGFYSFDLDIQLQTQIEVYDQDRCEWWTGTGDAERPAMAQEAYQQAEEVAQALIESTRDLLPGEVLSWDSAAFLEKVRDLVRSALLIGPLRDEAYRRVTVEEFQSVAGSAEAIEDLISRKMAEVKKEGRTLPIAPLDADLLSNLEGPFRYGQEPGLKLVWERLCIKLAWDAVDRMRMGAVRMLLLSDVIAEAEPSDITLKYLRLLSTCFVWGFDAECTILCRSVLDTAFREAIPEEGLALAKRIVIAHDRRLINDELRRAAFTVKERGDKAIHYEPGMSQDVIGTIRDTLRVVAKITQARSK